MGFWSNLAKGLGVAGAIGGAAFTGGGTLAALPAIMGAGGAVASGIASAKAKNRGEQGEFNQQNAQLASQQAGTAAQNEVQRAQLDLDRRQDDRVGQANAYKNALRAALAQHTQDAAFSREGFNSPVANIRFSGGSRPTAIGANGRGAAEEMNRQAMLELLEGPAEHAPVKGYQAPAPAEMPKAGFWEKLAGPVGMGLTLASNLTGARDNGAAPTPSARLRVPEVGNFA